MNKECKLAFAYLYEKRAATCLLALAVAFLFLFTELYHAPREMAVYTSLMLGTGAALAFAVIPVPCRAQCFASAAAPKCRSTGRDACTSRPVGQGLAGACARGGRGAP